MINYPERSQAPVKTTRTQMRLALKWITAEIT